MLSKKTLLQICMLFSIIVTVASQTLQPSVAPSIKPTAQPSRKPTGAPVHIYGNQAPVLLDLKVQERIVGALTVLIFVFMASEVLAPEILFLIALMVVTGCQIIPMTDTLSGM
jgi:hypothetical protein